MCTPYQFQVVSSFPEHEKKFLQWKEKARRETKKKGSYHAFHGSPITNWHSIIRTGSNSLTHSLAIPLYLVIISWDIQSFPLLYYSGIGLRSGFVPGIYMAQQASYSHAYMHVGQSGIPGVCRFTYLSIHSSSPTDRIWMISIFFICT